LNAAPRLIDLDSQSFRRAVETARDAITAVRLWQPEVAIVLGSGLGRLAELVSHSTSIPYTDIPNFPRTHAAGHLGRLILGYLSGMPVVLMQGRSHRYEGFANVDLAFPIHCMRALGAKTLMTTNAAGGLNPRFQAGDLMVLDSHIDFLWQRGLFGKPECAPAMRGVSPYDYDLLAQAKKVARKLDIPLHQGCYLATLGPTYETRSEYRMFRRTGADAVGMSTIPEVLAARDLGMATLAFSVITNVASTDMPVTTTHEEVVDTGNSTGPQLMKIIQRILEQLSGQPD
jgi:purine-nucleoside phosphorylase